MRKLTSLDFDWDFVSLHSFFLYFFWKIFEFLNECVLYHLAFFNSYTPQFSSQSIWKCHSHCWKTQRISRHYLLFGCWYWFYMTQVKFQYFLCVKRTITGLLYIERQIMPDRFLVYSHILHEEIGISSDERTVNLI